MTRHVMTWGRRRPLTAAVVVLCAVAFMAFAADNATGFARWSAFDSQAQALNESDGESLSCVSWSFPFRDRNVSVTARFDREELAAAESLSTDDVFGESGWLRERYVRHLVHAQSRSPFIERLAQEFRLLRDELRLDDDGYLELMVAAVQDIPYGEVTSDIRLPIEVVAYRGGVCTEKTVLLAALLVHEGWDSCVWVFDTQRHVGVGVASDDLSFHGSRYAFVETTEHSFVGQADSSYHSRGPIAAPPQLIELGGEESYGAGSEVAYVLSILELAEQGNVRLEAYHVFAEAAAEPHAGRYAAYALVQERASILEAFIRDHSHDRPGVYRTLLMRDADGDLNDSLRRVSAVGD